MPERAFRSSPASDTPEGMYGVDRRMGWHRRSVGTINVPAPSLAVAPRVVVCTDCGRRSVVVLERERWCGALQPGGSRCEGRMRSADG